MDGEENEPMMMEEGMMSKMDDKDSDEDPRDKDKKYKVCGVCSPVCSVIFIFILIVLELGFLIYELVVIENNSFFDNSFGLIYFVLILPFLFTIVVLIVFFFNYKDPATRAWIPEALLVAAISSFAIFVWTFIYISSMYDYKSVAVERKLNLGPRLESIENEATTEASQAIEKAQIKERELRDRGYYRQDKGMYILVHSLVPLLVGGLALFYFFALKDWCQPKKK